MILLIVFPVISVVVQSFHAQHEQVIEIVENCGPFGCTEAATVNQEATEALRAAEPLGRFVGFQNYINRGHLAFAEMAQAWRSADTWGQWQRSTRLWLIPSLPLLLRGHYQLHQN